MFGVSIIHPVKVVIFAGYTEDIYIYSFV